MGRHKLAPDHRRGVTAALAVSCVALGGLITLGLSADGQQPAAVSGDQTCSFTVTGTVVSTLNCVAAPTAPPVTAPPSSSPSVSPTPSATETTPPPTTTVPPTATSPTPTPATGPQIGWPGPDNTGIPTGIVTRPCSGTITQSGTYDSCKFSTGVVVKASNVTITRSVILGQVNAGDGTQKGLVISDTTIDCGCLSTSTTTPPAVSFSNFTLLRDDISHSGHGVQINDNVTVEDTWIHDLGANNQAHKDGIISNGGGTATIRHNNVECDATGCSAAMGLFGDFGTISGWLIDNNLFNTNGSYCFYGGNQANKPYQANNVTFTNNHFGTKFEPKCGQYGPDAYTGGPGSVWSGNVWDTGANAGKTVSQ